MPRDWMSYTEEEMLCISKPVDPAVLPRGKQIIGSQMTEVSYADGPHLTGRTLFFSYVAAS